MNKFIIPACPGGISNRVKCLVSAWRIEDKYKRKVVLYWPKNPICGCHFKDLFENDIHEIKKEEIKKKLKNRSLFLLEDEENVFKNRKEKILVSHSPIILLFKGEISENFAKEMPANKGKSIDHEFERIPKELREEILPYLRRLKPLKEIEKRINDFNKKHKLENCVGVHVRKGDFIVEGGPGDFSVDERFINRMKEVLKENKNQKFFLCTDSKEIEEKFKKIFGKKILIFPKTNFDRTEVIFTQEGLIDLLLLAKTKHIIGTYASTFTEMSWWFGGCKAKIETVATPEERKQLVLKIKKQRNNFKTKVKVFIYKIITPNYKKI